MGWEILMLENSEFVWDLLHVGGWWVYEIFFYDPLLLGPDPLAGHDFTQPLSELQRDFVYERADAITKRR